MAAGKQERQIAKKLTELAATKDARQRLLLAHEIQQAAVALEHMTVGDARHAGMTWTQIGGLFGMSKQAAQQRFKGSSGANRSS